MRALVRVTSGAFFFRRASMVFSRAIQGIGFDAPAEEVDLLFDEMDASGDGSISFKELHSALRQGAGALARGDFE